MSFLVLIYGATFELLNKYVGYSMSKDIIENDHWLLCNGNESEMADNLKSFERDFYIKLKFRLKVWSKQIVSYDS